MAPAPAQRRTASPSLQASTSTASRDAINLRTLRRADPAIQAILVSSAYVVLYTYSRGEGGKEEDGAQAGRWRKEGVEGSLFVYERSAEPTHGYLILNRNGMNNFSQPLTPRTRLDVQDQFVHLSHAAGGGGQDTSGGDDDDEAVVGLWFHAGNQEAEKVAAAMRSVLPSDSPTESYRTTRTTNAQTTVSRSPQSTQITTSTSTTASITQSQSQPAEAQQPNSATDGGLTLPDLLARLHASSPPPSASPAHQPLPLQLQLQPAPAAAPSRARDPPPHMVPPSAELSEEERASMALKHMLGLGPPALPPPLSNARTVELAPAANGGRNGRMLAEEDPDDSTESDSASEEEERIVRHPVAARNTKQAQQIARIGSPRAQASSPRPSHAQAHTQAGPATPGPDARARTPRLDRASPRPRAAVPGGTGVGAGAANAAQRDPKLKDSGYIPNPTLNGGRAGGAAAVDRERVRRAVGEGLDAPRAKGIVDGHEGRAPVGDAEGRREFVRNLLALIHTDESFVDDLWQRYTDRPGH